MMTALNWHYKQFSQNIVEIAALDAVQGNSR